MKAALYACIVLWGCALPFPAALGQKLRADSTYVESYRGYVMPRFLINRKTTGINYYNSKGGYSLRYQPNKTFSIGAGITYRFASLKLTMGIMEPHKSRGDTRNLDVQFHSYGRKFATDFLAQFYKGFFLPDRRFGTASSEFYVRPDLAVSALGASVQYISNHRKFSYRAAFQQTEWQKRSAGTLLIGLELFMGRFRADSTIVPSQLQDRVSDGVRKMRFIEFGPNIGYSYTWVHKKFFVNSGATVGLNAGINHFEDGRDKTTFSGVSPNTSIRISTGYNVRQWGLNVMFLSRALRLPEYDSRLVVMNTGTLRMNFVYRIYPTKKVRKLLKPIDRIEERLRNPGKS